MAFSSAFSRAFVSALPVYIAPMRAQRALYDGAAFALEGGVLKIGGRVLIGLSGAPYSFASADTAARWCAAGSRVIEAELALVDRLGESTRAEWIAGKQEKLTSRADAILARVVVQPDAAKRDALLAEALWCETKWAAYG